MTETRWWQYTQRVIGTDTAQEAARRAGFDKSAFTRWKNGARPGPEFVVKFARGYQVNVLEALVEAEFITDDEASLHAVTPTPREMLEAIGNEELALEFVRRLGVRLGTDDNVVSFTAKGRAAERAGLTGIPATEEERWAARDIKTPTPSDKINADSDAAGEDPDPEGPEGGA